ncbi:MAG: undecaprenyl diphosphate synthase family protein [Methanothrix sp.]|nr:undecaprenyl diphosphate synthase family protein [Methanothrix sp.]MCX8207286.1 undecaprenyl diphosphate synthase family protein [Methanothrix sp.]
MIHKLYEKLLEREVLSHPRPRCVVFVVSSFDGHGLEKFRDLIEWSASLGIESLLIHIGQYSGNLASSLEFILKETPADVSIVNADRHIATGRGGISVTVSLGYGGKREVTEAIRSVLRDVAAGMIEPEEIDRETIERYLRFKQKPDLVIRAGGRRLSDFMIWQAAYSELYFTDVDWASLRRLDFLRAIRDFQRRERRFGR